MDFKQRIDAVATHVELSNLVDTICRHYRYRLPLGLSYAEAANDIRDRNPELGELLDHATSKWFRLID